MLVSMYKPRHRRTPAIVIDSRVASGQADLPSRSECTRDTLSHAMCPQHSPEDYAEYMAAHVSNVYGTGTIPWR